MNPIDPARIKICNCNRTMNLDGAALARALRLETPLEVHTELCRKEAGRFQEALAAAAGEACAIGCTQEAALFTELASQREAAVPLRFFNIRELAGWSKEHGRTGGAALPKIAALIAAAALPDPEPVPAASFSSGGSLLVIGPGEAALGWAQRLSDQLEVNVLVTDAGRRGAAELPGERAFPVWSGRPRGVSGWLGQFEVSWVQENPIDPELCTRCNACVRVCPEQAIGFDYQIDLSRCRGHRECVAACGEVRAIDFSRGETPRSERFDLVLDLSAQPLWMRGAHPEGYVAPGRDPLEQSLAAARLARWVGEFERPQFVRYEQRLCAHGRSGKTGCTKCIDTCSTAAIRSLGDRVEVEPHLCQGCGGCATVCPSGAMTHAFPRVPELGARLRRMLAVYREAGGGSACVLIHGGGSDDAAGAGIEPGFASLITPLARRGDGLPARVLPLATHHPASFGVDLALAALAWGAAEVVWALTPSQDADYGEALRREITHVDAVLQALGYGSGRFTVIAAEDAPSFGRALYERTPAEPLANVATFNASLEKRTTLEFAIEYLARQAPARPVPQVIALKPGAPWGALAVNRSACTLCLACVGACPASALMDTQDAPRLRFVERNCVQCGLCERTCPENAITLVPQLRLDAGVREPVVLNEAEPFSCVRCSKPFGTRQMVEAMMGRLGAHSMFAGGTLRRLQMCADCRVIDMMENPDEARILDPKVAR